MLQSGRWKQVIFDAWTSFILHNTGHGISFRKPQHKICVHFKDVQADLKPWNIFLPNDCRVVFYNLWLCHLFSEYCFILVNPGYTQLYILPWFAFYHLYHLPCTRARISCSLKGWFWRVAGKALSSAEATLNVLSVAGLRLKSLAETPQQVLEVLSDLNLFYSILFSCWT